MCRTITWIFGVLYAIVALLFLAGTYGWFGIEPDPLSAVFLIPLGIPWIWLIPYAPEAMQPWLGLLAPAFNLLILMFTCRRISRT